MLCHNGDEQFFTLRIRHPICRV